MRRSGIDWLTLFLVLIIIIFGILNIYSVNEEFGGKQLLWASLGVIMIVGILISPLNNNGFFEIYAPILYIFCLLFLLGLIPFGKEINGAKAWYSIAGKFSIQPAEFAKIATTLMIAYLLRSNENMGKQSLNSFLQIGVVLSLPIILILLQPDLGSVLVFFAFILALYREGLSSFFIIVPILIGSIFIISVVWDPLWFLLLVGHFLVLALLLIINLTPVFRGGYRSKYTVVALFLALSIYFFVVIALSLSGILIDVNFVNFNNISKQVGVFLGSIGLIVSSASVIYILRSENNNVTNGSYSMDSYSSKEPIFFITTFFSTILFLLVILSSLSNKVFNTLPKHQKERVFVLFEGEEKYSKTAGYNLLYSKVAIGSGEFRGRGWNSGPVTEGKFVPEQHTDYIFSTVGEEWGFVGVSLLTIAFLSLIARIYYLAERQKSVFSRFFGYSVASILLIHFTLNVSMVTGLFPTVGIPLPFFSYGGSSLWAFTLFLFIFLKLNYEDNKSLI